MLRRRVLLACFALHFLIVLAISCRDALWLVARGYTIIPVAPEGRWQQAQSLASAALGEDAAHPYPGSEALKAYTHFAGIEAGYGYFAPNIPDSYKLVFELEYADGQIEHDLPLFESPESTLRFASLLDQIGQMESDPMREILTRLLATSMWQRHPGATKVRAVLGALTIPDVAEFEAGKRASTVFLYAYDFSVTPNPAPPAP